MKQLTTTDLLSLEEYDKSREQIKSDLLLHKKNRSLQSFYLIVDFDKVCN